MTGKQWLTIEDWLECTLPLCSLNIKHDGRFDRAKPDDTTMQTVFTSARIGGNVLSAGVSQESIIMTQFPEILAVLIYVEALEDNEALIIENARQVARIINAKEKVIFERLDEPQKVGGLTHVKIASGTKLRSAQFFCTIVFFNVSKHSKSLFEHE